jgi:putative glutamine amidotransferase
MPLLAICRGAQEINVALGGTLHQAVQEVPSMDDHRDDPSADRAAQWGPAHVVDVVPGGVVEQLLGTASFEVNSLHGQGVKRLAAGLRVEAVAPDGLIEAFSVDTSSGPSRGIQNGRPAATPCRCASCRPSAARCAPTATSIAKPQPHQNETARRIHL